MVMLRTHDTSIDDGGVGSRRIVAVLTAALLASGSFALAGLDGLVPDAASACGPGVEMLQGLPGPIACVHEDVPPPGVDVTEHVSTRELLAREGAGPTAHEAAEDLGVASTPAGAATSPVVACDGDGTSGNRVQAMYVVESDDPNRFAALEDTFKLWAAGVDDVVNRSAALSGGVRRVRFVTEAADGGTCEAKVLNVTVPANSLATFGSSIGALETLGHNLRNRKYLMWTDTSVLCGVGLMYLDDREGQDNANNGKYPQYARTDSGCWGFGNGSSTSSVEAHELLHTLGGVQGSAPNSTSAGHCTDESDAMCYADGTGTMRQICPPEREYLFDCNTNDYFSTSPAPGTYLDVKWNSADSSFLIGGGDGWTGPVTSLGASVEVNNPAVPGLSTQVEASPTLPPGRTLTSFKWRSARSDCVFSAPTELQSDVTCSASASGTTSVSAMLVDSTGATKTVTSPLTFATGTARPVTLDFSVASQPSGPASVCTGAAFPVQGTVTDVTTGQAVKGLTVSFTKQTATMTAPGAAGSLLTTTAGAAVLNGMASVPTTFAARTTGNATYAAATAAGIAAVPSTCSPDLTGTADKDAVYYGETVTVSGTLTRTVGGSVVPVSGASLPVKLTSVTGGVTKVATLATARTLADGSYSVAVKPAVNGNLSVSLAGSTAYTARIVQLGAVTVHLPSTDLTAAVDKLDVGYGDRVVVTGSLTRTAGALTTGSTTTAVAGAPVVVRVTAPGRTPTTVGSARTLADGSYTISVPLKVSGTMTVSYAGAAGLPADSVSLGSVTAGTWATAITLTGTPYGSGFLLNGVVSKTYAGVTSAAPGVRVKVVFTPNATGVPALVSAVTTNASGGYTAKVYPSVSGTYRVQVSGQPGYADSGSGTHTITRRAIHRLRSGK